MTLEGIDISYAQATTPSLIGLSFVFCRATYGGTGVDTMWATHSADVRSQGKVLGAYHFWYDGTSGATQAAHFLSIAPNADLYALDFEGSAVDQTGAKAFIAAVQAAGKKCALYHSLSGFPSWGQNYNWVADWSTTPPAISWTFWQYQGSPLDRDRFAGDAAALAALVSGSTGGINIPGGDDVDPTKDLPIATADIAATTLYADRDGATVIAANWAGGKAIGVYSKAASGTTNAKMPHGPTGIRVGLGSAPYTPTLCWVDQAAVSFVGAGDTVHKVELVVDGAVKSTVSV